VKIKKFLCVLAILDLGVLLFANYVNGINAVAKEIANGIPKNSTVVIFNFENSILKETENSVDIAKKFGMCLRNNGKKNFSVIDREEGEKLFYEERMYDFGGSFEKESGNLKATLNNFKADIAITGKYTITNESLILSNICAYRIPSDTCKPEIIKSCALKTIKLTKSEIEMLSKMEVELPQPPSREIDEFIKLKTNNSWVGMEITDIEGRVISSKQVNVGNFYKMKISLQEPSYIYVFSYDQVNNDIYFLHPIFDFDNKLQTEKAILIPNSEDKAIQAMAPAGKNLIKVIASKMPLDIEIPSDVSNYKYQIDELGRVLDVLKNSSSDSWSECKFYLEIAE